MMLTQGVPRASPRRCRRSPLLRPLTASSAAAQPPPQPPTPSAATDALRRREVLASLGCASAAVAAAASGALQPLPALARGRLKAPAEDEFQTLPPFEWRGSQHPGLRYADLSVGRGRALAPGDSVSLHFEARYPALRGTVAASSREARTLGANRTLAEPFATAWPGGVPPELSRPRPARPTRPSVGLTLRPADADSADAGLFIVTDVVAGGPAARGGVRPLDRLLAVAGAPAGGLTPAQLGALLNAGEAGSEVTLTLRAAGGGGGGASASAVAAPRDVSLLRENLPVPRPAAAPAGGPAGADSGRGGGGLYVGGVGPKPPPGLWAGLAGMRVGGRRTLLVPPELAYEDGYGEVPPGGAVSLDVELLSAEPQA